MDIEKIIDAAKSVEDQRLEEAKCLRGEAEAAEKKAAAAKRIYVQLVNLKNGFKIDMDEIFKLADEAEIPFRCIKQ